MMWERGFSLSSLARLRPSSSDERRMNRRFGLGSAARSYAPFQNTNRGRTQAAAEPDRV
jgi:hypothetical protein